MATFTGNGLAPINKMELEMMVTLQDAYFWADTLFDVTKDETALTIRSMIGNEIYHDDGSENNRELSKLEKNTIIWCLLWIQAKYY